MSIRFINTPYFNFKDKLARRNLILRPFSGTSIDLQDSASSRVKSIGLWGNSKQETTTGAQLLDFASNAIISASTYTFQNDILNITSVSGTYNAIFYDIFDLIKENGGKSINFGYDNISTTGDGVYSFRFAYRYEGESNTRYHNIVTSGAFEIPNDTSVFAAFALALYQNNSNTSNPGTLTIEKPILYFGTTKPDYEPYTDGASPNPNYPQEIKSSGDNGYINEEIMNKNFVDLNYYEKGGIDPSTGQDIIQVFSARGKNYIKVKPNTTYILSANTSCSNIRLAEYENDKTFIQRNQSTQLSSLLITTTANTGYLRWTINYNNTTQMTKEIAESLNLQLEEGSIATNYISHQEQTYTIPCQQPMRAIGDVKDTFVEVDGVWYERHNIIRKIYDGTEQFVSNLTNNGYYVYAENISNYLRVSGITCESNYFKATANGGFGIMQYGECHLRYVSNDNYKFFYMCTNISTVELFKEWLKEKYDNEMPVYVDYLLEEPIDLPCTQAQITALEALMKARTYKNITHIYSEDEVQVTLSGKYYAKC